MDAQNEGDETFTVVDVVGHLITPIELDWMPRVRMILEFGEIKAFDPFDRRGHVEIVPREKPFSASRRISTRARRLSR